MGSVFRSNRKLFVIGGGTGSFYFFFKTHQLLFYVLYADFDNFRWTCMFGMYCMYVGGFRCID